jgi:hypothetical protein
MNEIFWPEDYFPGFTDNFVSNEVIVAGLSAMDVWPFLSNAPLWPTYYSNSANIRFYDGKGPELEDGVRFYFETFGFPVEAGRRQAGSPRLAWLGRRRRYTLRHVPPLADRGCASSRRNPRRASRPRNWPRRSPT